jgi:circadian clock protein KaiC
MNCALEKSIEIGEALEGFEGVLAGLPTYRGTTSMMSAQDETHVP